MARTTTTQTDATPSGLWPAMLAVMGELGAVAKDAQADSGTRHRYASLGAVLDAARPVLWRHGIVLTQDTRTEGGLVAVDTHLVYAASGERVCSTVAVPPSSPTRKDGTPVLTEPQAVGVAITYARRYGILCALGLATEDSDGVAPADAGRRESPQQAAPSPRRAALEALRQRLHLDGETMRQRLTDIAAGSVPYAAGETVRTIERLAEAMGGDPRGYDALPEAGFRALLDLLECYPIRSGLDDTDDDLPL